MVPCPRSALRLVGTNPPSNGVHIRDGFAKSNSTAAAAGPSGERRSRQILHRPRSPTEPTLQKGRRRRLAHQRGVGDGRTIVENGRLPTMSDAFDYFRAYAVRALCKARSMPKGRIKHLQLVVGRIYNFLKKEAAYGPNTQHLEDFRTAQKLERSLDSCPSEPAARTRFAATHPRRAEQEVR